MAAFAGSLLAAPLATEAQQTGKVYRIGFLRAGPPPRTHVEGFQQGLRARGYIEGVNVVIEYRSTDGSYDDLPHLATELVRFNVDVILAAGAPAAFAARSATPKVPIIFVHVYDPVEIGLVTSVAHPGGNVTGLSQISADLGGKRLELIKGLVPKPEARRHSLAPGESNQPGSKEGRRGGSAHSRRRHQIGAGPGPK